MTREEREAKLGEAREAAARRKAAQRGSGTQHTAAGTGDEAHEPEDVSTKPDTVKVPGSSNKDLDPAKREVLMEALVEVEEEIAKIRKRDQAERGSMLRALKKRYHPDSQRIMKWLYEAIFDHINKYTADIEQ